MYRHIWIAENAMEYLNTQSVTTTFNTPMTTYQSSGHYKVEIPQSSVTVVKPLTYQFRVAEYVNDKDEVVRVGLQVAIFEHDNYGVRQLRQDWTDVERVRLPITT
jgi:hypothetical protein